MNEKIIKVLNITLKVCSVVTAIIQVVKPQIEVKTSLSNKPALSQEDAKMLAEFLKEDVK